MVNTKIQLIISFAAKDGEALYSQQKQDREQTGSGHELLIAKFSTVFRLYLFIIQLSLLICIHLDVIQREYHRVEDN